MREPTAAEARAIHEVSTLSGTICAAIPEGSNIGVLLAALCSVSITLINKSAAARVVHPELVDFAEMCRKTVGTILADLIEPDVVIQ